ncbi:MAG: DUF3857 domain-containing protein, partial [Moheibacter sp.]
MKLICSFLALSIYVSVFCQLNPKTKWGNVNQSEFDYTEVPYEKDASAVILYEKGEFTIARLDNENKIYRRIKILTEEGKKYATQEIFYYDFYPFDEIRNIKAQSINLVDGKIVKTAVKNSEIFTSETSDLGRSIRFAIPNVKVGTIIEVEFSSFGINNYAIEPWEFQHEIPTLYSTFEMNVQAPVDYTPICLGEKIVKYAKENQRKREYLNVWTVEDLPSIEKIELVYNKRDAAEKIIFQRKGYRNINFDYVKEVTSWFDLRNSIIESNSKMISQTVVNKISLNISPGLDEQDQLEKVLKYFRDNFKWNNGYRVQPFRSFADIEKEKKGNSADLNLLLNQLLKKKNIQSELVLVSQRDNGRVKVISPFANQFNTIVNLVKMKDGRTIFIDAAYLPIKDYDFMPLINFNQYGLILDTGADRFILMNPPNSEYHSVQNYSLKDGKFIYVRNDKKSGYFKKDLSELSKKWRKYNEQTQGLDLFFKDVKTDFKESDENSFEMERMISESPKLGGNSFYQIENPLKPVISQFKLYEADRERPLEFNFPFFYKTDLIIDIPDGYRVEIPEAYQSQIQTGSKELMYYQNAEVENGKLKMHFEFLLLQSVFDKNYSEIKSFFDQIIQDS